MNNNSPCEISDRKRGVSNRSIDPPTLKHAAGELKALSLVAEEEVHCIDKECTLLERNGPRRVNGLRRGRILPALYYVELVETPSPLEMPKMRWQRRHFHCDD